MPKNMFRMIVTSTIALIAALFFSQHLMGHLYAQNDTGAANTAADLTIYFPIIQHQLSGVPLSFSGGPLYRTAILSDVWYLRSDGQISLSSNGVETFPLDPELGIDSIAAKGDTLFALAQDGLYKRSASTLEWQQWNDLQGRFLSAGASELWMTPLDTPGEVWVSQDEVNWQSQSQGLTGTVLSPVLVNSSPDAGYFVISEEGGSDTLWHASNNGSSLQWQRVDPIPGSAIDRASGLFGRVVDASTALGTGVMLGGGDGKLYEYRFYNSANPSNPTDDGWVAVWDFGATNYALPLVNQAGSTPLNEVAVINRNTGQIALYEGIITESGAVPKREWHLKAFPFAR